MVDIKGTFTDSNYTWAEDRPGGGGGGPRSMKIMGAALGTKTLLWGVDPNPHGNNAYNAGGQALLYAGFVKKINAGWPTKDKVSFTNLKSFDDIPTKKRPSGWQKFDAKKQKTALDTYNKDTKTELEAKAEADYRKEVLTHLAARKKSKFTFGGVEYTLG